VSKKKKEEDKERKGVCVDRKCTNVGYTRSPWLYREYSDSQDYSTAGRNVNYYSQCAKQFEFLKKTKTKLAVELRPIIPVLQRQKQEDHKFEASLCAI
jgi:hypothetical protein